MSCLLTSAESFVLNYGISFLFVVSSKKRVFVQKTPNFSIKLLIGTILLDSLKGKVFYDVMTRFARDLSVY